MKRNITIGLLLALAAILLGVFIFDQKVLSPFKEVQTIDTTESERPVEPVFPKDKHSITEASSIWVIVNKSFALNPAEYVPSNLIAPNVPLRLAPTAESMLLTKETAAALEKMRAAAQKDGVDFKVASGYRSFHTQEIVYNNEVRQYGQAVADTQSARPSHSEHQTGLAVDLQDINGQCVVADCFGDLPAGKWLAKNSWKYGFILRYSKDKQSITGYRYEPWHFRYVGQELAAELQKQNIETLEEFFNVVETPPY